MDCGAIAVVAILAFAGVSVGYGIKIFTAPEKVAAEFKHPIAGNLFGTFFISLLLLPILIAPVNLLAARTIWAIAAGAMLVFAWVIVNRWMGSRQQVEHATPAWIVPVVGLLDVPLAIPSLDLAQFHGLMVFALAVGLFFAIPLFTLIFSRLIFEPPLPDVLRPSLLILAAPFAVGFSAYATSGGEIDLFASALYMLTLFILVILLRQLANLPALLPVPGILVGSQFSSSGVGRGRASLLFCSPRNSRGCDRCDPVSPGDRYNHWPHDQNIVRDCERRVRHPRQRRWLGECCRPKGDRSPTELAVNRD